MEEISFLDRRLFMVRPTSSVARIRQIAVMAGIAALPFLSGCTSESSKTITLTAGNFEEKVLKSKQPVLVDFWAEWCKYCKDMDPVIKELAAEYEGRAVVAKLNADDYPEILQKYGVKWL